VEWWDGTTAEMAEKSFHSFPFSPLQKCSKEKKTKAKNEMNDFPSPQIPAEGEVEAAAASAGAAVTKQVKREESIAKGAHWRLLKNRRVVSGRWR
jgi:hypothetical protein